MSGYVAYASPSTIVTEAGYQGDPPAETLPITITTMTFPTTSVTVTV